MILYHPLKLKKKFLFSKKCKYLLLDKQESVPSLLPLLFENLLQDSQILWDLFLKLLLGTEERNDWKCCLDFCVKYMWKRSAQERQTHTIMYKL